MIEFWFATPLANRSPPLNPVEASVPLLLTLPVQACELLYSVQVRLNVISLAFERALTFPSVKLVTAVPDRGPVAVTV